MSGVNPKEANPETPRETIEFKGHLIDSLTLSKIADHIEQHQGSYELNDICIGVHRQDVSSVTMTVFANTQEQLQQIMELLKPYGAISSGQADAELAACPADGTLPEQAFSVRLPKRVKVAGQWRDLDSDTLALTVDGEMAHLIPVSELRKGQPVVVGSQGIEW